MHSERPRHAPRAAAPGADGWRLPPELDRIAYGGDYNPEQWPEELWPRDVELMRTAGVNLVTVGVFSWALLEPRPGHYTFGWLDRLLDLLHAGGIAVDLATPTVVPPAWFFQAHPEARPVTRDGRVLGFGSRAGYCPSSPAYAEAAARITEQLALRYGGHPALALWHVHNEYGAPTGASYSDAAQAAFRDWLRDRYRDIDALNEAWGTTFWGQRYGDFDQVDLPRETPTTANPAHRLDFARFSSDALLACFRRERDILHRLSPGVPVTTNFMTTNCASLDYWAWAAEVDVVSNDHYLNAEQPRNHIDLAMSADLTRGLAGGGPWLLMEHSTSAVNWQPRNLAKRPGEMRRNSLAHIARGSEGALFFQWRASRFGAEKFHSAMVPHAGPRGRIWREVVELGGDVAALDEVRGATVVPDVAIVWDWQSWWAQGLEWRPSVELDYRERIAAYYESLWDRHLTVDFVAPEADLSGRPLVVVPALYLTTPAAAANLRRYVEAGGTLLVSYFSGIVDANDALHPGAMPGALRDLLGLEIEEFLPLRAGETVTVGDGLRADAWAEAIDLTGAAAVHDYRDGPAAGRPAVTRHELGRGRAWYVSTRLTGQHLGRLLDGVLADAGVAVPADLPADVEVVRRRRGGTEYLFAINHTGDEVKVPASGTDLLTGESCADTTTVPPGGVRVVRLAAG
ncbi:beta-galactosidase [Marinactinospora rubrisoli]|uniref:Beta-galactosidase n=1 Tax=Marinactinospora rubrisoli TaxID=2715399 RepID=A0ABW2KEK8_9ACTN